jgi:polysaccharide biosynthesis/export protein VpsN
MKSSVFLPILLVTLLLAHARGVSAQTDALLRRGETIELRIGGVPQEEATLFNSTYTIDGSGRLNLPHIGVVTVAGMTAGQAKDQIERVYRSRDIYTNPAINIIVTSQNRQVSVGGAVKLPQRVTYTPDLTVLAAINASGGFNEFANQAKVRVLRAGQVIMVNCKEVRKNPTLDVRLQPGDIIEVQESFW